jgi:hypothetical protein
MPATFTLKIFSFGGFVRAGWAIGQEIPVNGNIALENIQ